MERFPRRPILEATFLSATWLNLMHQQYNQEARTYHNEEHIDKLWSYYNALFYGEKSERDMHLAILFHDVIYEIGSKRNEIDSAREFERYAFQFMKGGDFQTFSDIRDTILATADHTNPENDNLPEWGKVMLDLDLYELGSSQEIYKENGNKIFQEFAGLKLTSEQKINGRIGWLEKMLSGPPIFRIFTNREDQARKNMEDERKELKEALLTI